MQNRDDETRLVDEIIRMRLRVLAGETVSTLQAAEVRDPRISVDVIERLFKLYRGNVGLSGADSELDDPDVRALLAAPADAALCNPTSQPYIEDKPAKPKSAKKGRKHKASAGGAGDPTQGPLADPTSDAQTQPYTDEKHGEKGRSVGYADPTLEDCLPIPTGVP